MKPPIVTEHLTLFPANRRDDRFLGTLFYEAADPYAVTLSYVDHATEAETSATFARTLLVDYLKKPQWIGPDRVVFGPHTEPGHTVITIAPDDPKASGGDVTLYCSTEMLQQFTSATLREVPLGAEDPWIDWHAELAMLLPDRQRTIAVRQTAPADVFDGWGTGVLTAHWEHADAVVVQVADADGLLLTWQVNGASLACQAVEARRAGNSWFRLALPGDDCDVLLRCEDVYAFLAGVGGAAA
ncbi:SsgA family sporulation/cell division regulator [Nonomuraea sp. NPDC046802]|uniref:SsgA family sporulation/cell division regulator n=1 Tax=Nonomuraea sp. NPDC046802 TaxID=3154919 RepID=UPI0033D608B0